MYLVNNVEALYPRINKTYRFDNAENRSVPCDASEDGASYEMSFRMTKDQAKALFLEMSKAYQEKKEAKWPAKLEMPFIKDEDGSYVGKAKLKGAYGAELTAKPMQCDARGTELPDDFMLTTGSTVNVAVVFVPYNMRDHGVSLRLKAVQVIKYVEVQKSNPFSAVEGFTQGEDDNPFAPIVEPVSQESMEETTADVFGDDDSAEPEATPKKVAKKKAAAKPKAKDEDLSSIIDDWDDE
tara:strand:+ start:11129 stop:11845 length:717 start_codon:yes stop_codon:yes gene_type:complete